MCEQLHNPHSRIQYETVGEQRQTFSKYWQRITSDEGNGVYQTRVGFA